MASTAATAAATATTAAHRLNAGVVRALKGSPLPGLTVVLVDKRAGPNPASFKSYGVARLGPVGDLGTTRPMTRDTILPIGSSLAKNFTALVLAQLHAEGKLRLDDPITAYVPGLRIAQAPGMTQPITARHLLSHTSGIREWRHRQDLVDVVRHRLPAFLQGPARAKATGPMTLEEYYCGGSGGGSGSGNNAQPIVAVGTPGGQHIKSHHNYGLLALAAEKVTGQDIHALIHQRVLDPLEMADTSLVAPAGTEKEKEGRVGSSFKWSGKAGFRPIPAGGRFDASHGRPRAVGGSAYSTAADMAKYLHALVDPEGPGARGVVTAPIMDEMLRPVYSRDPFLPAQALSFAVEECQTNNDPEVAYVTCGQGMGFGGYQTAICFSRQRGVGVAVLCNAGSDSYELSQVAAEAFHEATVRARAAAVAAVGSHSSHSDTAARHQQQHPPSSPLLPAADSNACPPSPSPSPLKSLERGRALGRAFGINAEGFESPVLWPEIVGVYQLPVEQLSARVLWTLGGEVQVYVEDSHLRMRALWGPLRTKLFYTKEKGQILWPARDGHPLHYSVAGNARQVLATPVNGFTDVAFDPRTRQMHIGLVTLIRAPWYRSLRLWLMGLIAYEALQLIGKGKAVDILSALFVIG